MKFLFAILFMFIVASPCLCATITPNASIIFNVVEYGATGDGQADDSQAFLKAWQDVCGATEGTATLLIPEGKTFMLQPVLFEGPCKPTTINVNLQGKIIAPNDVNAWKWPDNDDKEAWVGFRSISGLVINGGGQIDGQGAAWWSCDSDGNCDRPTALHFNDCKNLQLGGLTHINSPRNHISINRCDGSRISNLNIIAPEQSPNTDGIDISESSNVHIRHCWMATGDDCIAINNGSSYINITGVTCGPGHGISVGSLGEDGAYATVEEINVRNWTFKGTKNGARIKTWMGGSGYARKITFADIILEAAHNPVIIDQQYDALVTQSAMKVSNSQSAVKVSDVTYAGIRGTSADEDAIKLNCDPTIGCTNIVLSNITITADVAAAVNKTYATCTKAQGTSDSCIPQVPCLS